MILARLGVVGFFNNFGSSLDNCFMAWDNFYMATIPAKFISFACILVVLSFPAFGEDVRLVRFPVANYSSPEAGAVWVPPSPDSKPVLDIIPEGRMKSGARNASIAMMVVGGLLCAGGIVVVTHGLSHDMNSDTIHTGTLMIISGALTAALFSVVFRATAGDTPKTIAPE